MGIKRRGQATKKTKKPKKKKPKNQETANVHQCPIIMIYMQMHGFLQIVHRRDNYPLKRSGRQRTEYEFRRLLCSYS